MAHKVHVINGKKPSAGVGGVSDKDLSNLAISFHTKGIVLSTHYAVTQNGTPNMTVLVAAGKAYVPNPAGDMLYSTELDTQTSVNISSNASGNPRIDALVIKVDTGVTPNNYGDNVPSLVVVQGTPAASPVAPDDTAIQTAVGASNGFLRLANITVSNGASSIVTANISDQRIGAEFKLMTGRIKYNTSTNKLQFSHDGSNYSDLGSGTLVPTFTVVGVMATGTSIGPLLIIPFPVVITKAFAIVKTGPTGADLIFDINKNGTSIWASNQSNRLKIVAGATSGNQTSFDTTSLAEGDYVGLDIDQVGSTIAGADATIELYCKGA